MILTDRLTPRMSVFFDTRILHSVTVSTEQLTSTHEVNRMNSFRSRVNRLGWPWAMALAVAMIVGLVSTVQLHAQALGWDGETGAFVTPLAYTASSETQKIHPVVAYHYFNAGPVIGDFQEISIEVGLGKRLEFGYTHEFHASGGNIQLSPLWHSGFEIFNGKVNLLPELQEDELVPSHFHRFHRSNQRPRRR